MHMCVLFVLTLQSVISKRKWILLFILFLKILITPQAQKFNSIYLRK